MDAVMQRNDPADALIAAKSIVKASEGLPLTEKNNEALNHVVASVRPRNTRRPEVGSKGS